MRFGFSYVGLIYLVMLMAPNLMWTKNKPRDYDRYVANESKVLLAFERTGEVLVSTVALIFADFNLRPRTVWSVWLVVSFILMILYEVFWIRYFRSEKTMADFYSGLAGIPQLDHARHYDEDDHQGHYDLGAVMDKKFLDFRVVRICFVSHNMHPF